MIEEAKLNDYYSAIADKLDEMIPCVWKRVVLYAEELGNVSYTAFYFYTDDGAVHSSGDVSEEYNISRDEFSCKLRELWTINKDLWLEFKDSGEPVWCSFTYDLNSEKEFKIKFGYEMNEDISEMERRIRWAYDDLGIIPRGKRGKKLLKDYLDQQKRNLPDELKCI